MKKINEQFKTIREINGLSQEDLAEKMNLYICFSFFGFLPFQDHRFEQHGKFPRIFPAIY